MTPAEREQAVSDRAVELLGEDHGMKIAEHFDSGTVQLFVSRDSKKLVLGFVMPEWLELEGGQVRVDAAIRSAAATLDDPA